MGPFFACHADRLQGSGAGAAISVRSKPDILFTTYNLTSERSYNGTILQAKNLATEQPNNRTTEQPDSRKITAPIMPTH